MSTAMLTMQDLVETDTERLKGCCISRLSGNSDTRATPDLRIAEVVPAHTLVVFYTTDGHGDRGMSVVVRCDEPVRYIRESGVLEFAKHYLCGIERFRITYYTAA